MNVYLVIGDRIGTVEARDLAQQLVRWHDAMVKHLRVLNHRGRRCLEGCPHETAATLWSAAMDVFGDDAGTLRFLQTHAGGATRHEMTAALEARA